MRLKLTALLAAAALAVAAAPAVAHDSHHSARLNAKQLAFHDGMRKL